MTWKFLDFQGLRTLAEFVNKVKETADDNASAVSELESDFQSFSELTASALEEMGQALDAAYTEELSSDEVQKLWNS